MKRIRTITTRGKNVDCRGYVALLTTSKQVASEAKQPIYNLHIKGKAVLFRDREDYKKALSDIMALKSLTTGERFFNKRDSVYGYEFDFSDE